METNVVSFAEYKKEKKRKKLNRFEKIGLAINGYFVILSLLALGIVISIRNDFDFSVMPITVILTLISLYQVLRLTDLIKKDDYYSKPLYFPVLSTVKVSVLISSIVLYYALIERPVHLQPFVYLAAFLILIDIFLIAQFLKKEKYYR